MLEVGRADDIEEIPKGEWNALLPRDTLYLSHEHLTALKRSAMEIPRFRYLQFSNETGPVGAAVIYAIDTPLGVFRPKRLSPERLARARQGAPRLAMRTVECGIPTAVGQSVFWKDPAAAPEILRALIDEMWALGKETRCHALILRDIPFGKDGPAEALADKRHRFIPFLPNTRLEIRWNSWEEYLASLRKKYRQRILKNQQAFDESGITVEHVRDFGAAADDSYRLYLEVYARASEIRRECLSPEYFAGINEYLGDRSSVLLYRRAERIVGFDLLLHDEDSLRCLYTGFDYGENDTAKLYFNSYYQDLRIAIEEGKKSVEWGLGAYEAKLALGAQTVPLRLLLVHKRALFSAILAKIFSITLGVKPMPQYRVFREEATTG